MYLNLNLQRRSGACRRLYVFAIDLLGSKSLSHEGWLALTLPQLNSTTSSELTKEERHHSMVMLLTEL